MNDDNIDDVLISAPYAGWDRKNPEAPTGKVYAVFGSKTGRFCAADGENISDPDFKSKSTNEGFQCLFEAESRGFGSTLDINEYNNKKVLHAAASESDEIFKVEILDVFRLGLGSQLYYYLSLSLAITGLNSAIYQSRHDHFKPFSKI